MKRQHSSAEGFLTWEMVAALVLVVAASAAGALLRQNAWLVVVLAGGAGILAILVMGLGKRRTLRELTKAAERLSAGDLDDAVDEGTERGYELRARRALERIRKRLANSGAALETMEDVLNEYRDNLDKVLSGLRSGFGEQLDAVEGTATSLTQMNQALKAISEHGEALAAAAEESASSILEMAAANDEVAENMVTLAASVEQTTSSIEQMTVSIKQVAFNVDTLATTAEETSASMNEIDISIRQVENFANESARLSHGVTSSAKSGVEAISQTLGGIDRIRDSSTETVAMMTGLGEKIQEIGKILTVIDEVSEQTKLLALNAAIIAAQAGEHGKGFAVVADEIKDLAERSADSTEEIAGLIEAVQRESSKAVQAVEEGARAVDEGVKVSSRAENALNLILQSAERSTQMVQQIAQATVEQAQGTNRVAEAITSIAEKVQQMAVALAEHARGAEQISKSADKMRNIAQHVERSSQEQTKGSQQITRAIEKITAMVNQISVAQKEQTRGGEQILQAMEKLRATARRHEQILADLQSRSQGFQEQIGRMQERVRKFRR